MDLSRSLPSSSDEKAATAASSAKMIQAEAQVVSQLENKHQIELAQRQRAADALQQWSTERPSQGGLRC